MPLRIARPPWPHACPRWLRRRTSSQFDLDGQPSRHSVPTTSKRWLVECWPTTGMPSSGRPDMACERAHFRQIDPLKDSAAIRGCRRN
jgi:hypothetical protein